MNQSLKPEPFTQQLRRLQAVFKNEAFSISMRVTNRPGKHGMYMHVVGYIVTHERLSDPIISVNPQRAVDKLMAKRRITGVEQYCRMYLFGYAS